MAASRRRPASKTGPMSRSQPIDNSRGTFLIAIVPTASRKKWPARRLNPEMFSGIPHGPVAEPLSEDSQSLPCDQSALQTACFRADHGTDGRSSHTTPILELGLLAGNWSPWLFYRRRFHSGSSLILIAGLGRLGAATSAGCVSTSDHSPTSSAGLPSVTLDIDDSSRGGNEPWSRRFRRNRMEILAARLQYG